MFFFFHPSPFQHCPASLAPTPSSTRSTLFVNKIFSQSMKVNKLFHDNATRGGGREKYVQSRNNIRAFFKHTEAKEDEF